MNATDARTIAHSLARSENPRISKIGLDLLALKTDEELVQAVRMIRTILPSLQS